MQASQRRGKSMTNASEVLACKDCIHANRDVISKVFFYYGKAAFECKLAARERKYTNFVNGKTKIKKKKQLCENERENGKCGPNGKNWQPKKKEHIFKLLRREP